MIGALLAGMMLWGTAAAPAAAQPPAPPPVEAYFTKPVLNGLRLSPSGRYLASIQRRGDAQAVVVLDRQTGKTTMVTRGTTDHVGFDWIEWKGEDRLLLRTWLFDVMRANNKPDGPVIGYRYGRYIEAADRDGRNLVIMFHDNPDAVPRNTGFLDILDALPGDPRHALVTALDARGYLGVWRIDVADGSAVLIEAGDEATVGWGVDKTGAVIARTELRDGRLVFQGRPPGGAWRDLQSALQPAPGELADFELLGPGPAADQLYVAARETTGAGLRRLRVFDLVTGALTDPHAPASDHDLSAILYRPGTHDLAATCAIADVYGCSFLDPIQEAQFRGVSRFFEGTRNLSPVSMSADARLWVLSVTGTDQPGAYYLFDADARRVDLLDNRYPAPPLAALGPGEPFAYKARDGTQIPAYLTLPPGGPKGPLPLVVMVHDGPERRDSLDYDPLAQFLAGRGYLVLKANFRGSGGYGRLWAEAGHGQWGGRMQQDVDDGVQALVAAGRADPGRVCIIGGGYGGYAALEAAATRPDLYRCVAGWGAPSDLPSWLRARRKKLEGEQGTRLLASVGDPAAEEAKLAAASPLTHVADYRAPVLLIHGADDDVVPVEQSRRMAKALDEAGKQVTLLVLDDEGHADFTPAHGQQMYAAIGDFLARSIGKAGAAAPP